MKRARSWKPFVLVVAVVAIVAAIGGVSARSGDRTADAGSKSGSSASTDAALPSVLRGSEFPADAVKVTTGRTQGAPASRKLKARALPGRPDGTGERALASSMTSAEGPATSRSGRAGGASCAGLLPNGDCWVRNSMTCSSYVNGSWSFGACVEFVASIYGPLASASAPKYMYPYQSSFDQVSVAIQRYGSPASYPSVGAVGVGTGGGPSQPAEPTPILTPWAGCSPYRAFASVRNRSTPWSLPVVTAWMVPQKCGAPSI